MLNRRRSRPKFTRLRALFAGVALLGWAIPAVAFIAYVFCVDGFIATDRFLGLSIALSSAVAAVLTAGLLPVLWRDGKAILATGSKAGLIKVVLVAVVGPFLFFFPLQFSLAQILPHASSGRRWPASHPGRVGDTRFVWQPKLSQASQAGGRPLVDASASVRA